MVVFLVEKGGISVFLVVKNKGEVVPAVKLHMSLVSHTFSAVVLGDTVCHMRTQILTTSVRFDLTRVSYCIFDTY